MNTNRKTFRAAQWGKVLLLGFLAMGLPGHGEATSGSFNAPIEIFAPLGASQIIPLNFGNLFCSELSTCSITVASNGICTKTGPGSVCTIFVRNATFSIEGGAPNAFYNITLPNSITLTDTGSGFDLTSGPFGTNLTSLSVRLNTTQLIGRLTASGDDIVNVGAKVMYTGSMSNIISTFAITVSYQ